MIPELGVSRLCSLRHDYLRSLLGWRLVADGRMPALPAVRHLNVLEGRGLRLVLGLEPDAVRAFSFNDPSAQTANRHNAVGAQSDAGGTEPMLVDDVTVAENHVALGHPDHHLDVL
ncbi:MAG: hypothetical protein AAGG47_04720, partial [Pseudomonadota bacterium]